MTRHTSVDRRQTSAPYQLFMLALCTWALMVLGVGSFFPLDAATLTILDYADAVVCGPFFIDFLYSLLTAERRLHYLVTWEWINRLSSIPTVGAFRFATAWSTRRSLEARGGVPPHSSRSRDRGTRVGFSR
jgi:hypothetical protein